MGLALCETHRCNKDGVMRGLDPPAGRSPFGDAKAAHPSIFTRCFEEDGLPGLVSAMSPV
jgi:hypothetical protein